MPAATAFDLSLYYDTYGLDLDVGLLKTLPGQDESVWLTYTQTDTHNAKYIID